MKKIIITLGLVLSTFLVAPSASSNEWKNLINNVKMMKDFNVFLRPNGAGVQVSGLGNWVIVGVDKNGAITITNQVSTRKIKTTPAQRKKKPHVNVGLGN
jgi:hypothetical protein